MRVRYLARVCLPPGGALGPRGFGWASPDGGGGKVELSFADLCLLSSVCMLE